MATLDAYNRSVERRARHDASQLRLDFEQLKSLKVTLPAGEKAYWTVPRQQGEWRLPRDTEDTTKSEQLLILPVRDDSFMYNAYLAVVPQPIVMHRKVANLLEKLAVRMFQHFPEENTLAQREHNVPMLIGRFDVIVNKNGTIQLCELDDVCSLWPAMSRVNPITETYLRQIEVQLGMPIYTAELFQYADWPLDVSPRVRKEFAHIWHFDDSGNITESFVPRADSFRMMIVDRNGIKRRQSQSETDRSAEYYEKILQKYYLHNEDHWRGDINDAWLLENKAFELQDVALSVRAFRNARGFGKHIDRYGPRSISMAWHRDSKMPLVEDNLAVLAANLEVAVEFARQWQIDFPDELLVFKTLYGARTEGTAIFSAKGTKPKGVSSAAQIARKFGKAAELPIVVQPYREPDNLSIAGVRFLADDTANSDRSIIRSVEHIGSQKPGERVVAGEEGHFPMIFRSFVVYLPKEKRIAHVGGLWQATDGRIVHGGAHSVAGPLYIDGLERHPNAQHTPALEAAQSMLERYRFLMQK